MKTYYLSGPMRGYPEYNFPAFARAAAELRSVGFQILSPHEKPSEEGVPTDQSQVTPEVYRAYLREDVRMLTEKCDGIILLAGWPKSEGARLELAVALGLKLEVYTYIGGHLVQQ